MVTHFPRPGWVNASTNRPVRFHPGGRTVFDHDFGGRPMFRFRLSFTDRRFTLWLEELNGRDVPGGVKGAVAGAVIVRSPVAIELPSRGGSAEPTLGSKPGGAGDPIHLWGNMYGQIDTRPGSKPGGAGNEFVP